jgi:hypothetical protein
MANGRTGAMIFSKQGGCSAIPVEAEPAGGSALDLFDYVV